MKEVTRRMWEHQDGDAYGVILARVVGGAPFAIVHTLATAVRGDLDVAIDDGFSLGESDDFNVGVWRDGKLVATLWMHEVVDDNPALLAGIEREING